MSFPPPVPGFSWRVVEGASQATVEALSPDGRVAATCALSYSTIGDAECRAALEGAVGPTHRRRGLGRALLAWAEAEAREHFAEEIARGIPAVLRVDVDAPAEDAVTLYRAAGLTLASEEDEMRRELPGALPAAPVPGNVTLEPWSEDSAPLFHHAYSGAFRDRPGFPNWEERRWRAAFTGAAAFSPALSSVAMDGPEPAAFIVCWVAPPLGWVAQMGVRPEWRGKGLGAALLAGALRGFAGLGLERAALDVATNNPGARRLYDRMGFHPIHNWQSWRQTLS